MKLIYQWFWSFVLLLLASCGGGGGGSTVAQTSSESSVIAGQVLVPSGSLSNALSLSASSGAEVPLSGATACAYNLVTLDSYTKSDFSTPLCATTDEDGEYSLDFSHLVNADVDLSLVAIRVTGTSNGAAVELSAAVSGTGTRQPITADTSTQYDVLRGMMMARGFSPENLAQADTAGTLDTSAKSTIGELLTQVRAIRISAADRTTIVRTGQRSTGQLMSAEDRLAAMEAFSKFSTELTALEDELDTLTNRASELFEVGHHMSLTFGFDWEDDDHKRRFDALGIPMHVPPRLPADGFVNVHHGADLGAVTHYPPRMAIGGGFDICQMAANENLNPQKIQVAGDMKIEGNCDVSGFQFAFAHDQFRDVAGLCDLVSKAGISAIDFEDLPRPMPQCIFDAIDAADADGDGCISNTYYKAHMEGIKFDAFDAQYVSQYFCDDVVLDVTDFADGVDFAGFGTFYNPSYVDSTDPETCYHYPNGRRELLPASRMPPFCHSIIPAHEFEFFGVTRNQPQSNVEFNFFDPISDCYEPSGGSYVLQSSFTGAYATDCTQLTTSLGASQPAPLPSTIDPTSPNSLHTVCHMGVAYDTVDREHYYNPGTLPGCLLLNFDGMEKRTLNVLAVIYNKVSQTEYVKKSLSDLNSLTDIENRSHAKKYHPTLPDTLSTSDDDYEDTICRYYISLNKSDRTLTYDPAIFPVQCQAYLRELQDDFVAGNHGALVAADNFDTDTYDRQLRDRGVHNCYDSNGDIIPVENAPAIFDTSNDPPGLTGYRCAMLPDRLSDFANPAIAYHNCRDYWDWRQAAFRSDMPTEMASYCDADIAALYRCDGPGTSCTTSKRQEMICMQQIFPMPVFINESCDLGMQMQEAFDQSCTSFNTGLDDITLYVPSDELSRIGQFGVSHVGFNQFSAACGGPTSSSQFGAAF